MPTTLELQGARKLRKIMELWLPRALSSRELLKVFPMRKEDATSLVYERRQVQTGVQAARGLGGATQPVSKPGVDQYVVDPGYYGDHYTVEERELINLRDAGKWEDFENYESQAARGAEHLTRRFLDRCELSIGQLLTTGGFTATTSNGVNMYNQIFDVQTFTPHTLFSDLNNSQPLNYIRDLIPILELGRSVNFQKGYMLMSRPTLNLILKNQNPADLSGRRLNYGQTINSLEDFNEIMVSNDLPEAKVYDKGYYPDPTGSPFDPPGNTPGTFTRFIPNGSIVLVGVREDGEQLGEYRLTRAGQNEVGKAGEWYQVEDRRTTTPPQVILRAGHNGGPVLFLQECTAYINAALSTNPIFSGSSPSE